MPANTINGWTGASLGPSYAVVNSILGGASGTPVAAASPLATSAPPPATAPVSGGGTPAPAPLPSTAPAMPPGWGSSPPPSVGGSPTVANTRSSPVLTPEQSYSRYLQSRGVAENSTPVNSIMDWAANYGSFSPGQTGINYTPFATGVSAPGTGFGFGSPAQSTLFAQIAGLPLSPNSLAYGTPAAQAPAPTPRWGYPTGYGQQATPSGWTSTQGISNNSGYGFGGNQGGFGF